MKEGGDGRLSELKEEKGLIRLPHLRFFNVKPFKNDYEETVYILNEEFKCIIFINKKIRFFLW
jgi:hypothetical protein